MPRLEVFGDSKVIVDWSNSLSKLHVLEQDHWCDCIVGIKSSFIDLSIRNIFKEHNVEANEISNEALSLEMGDLVFTEYMEGAKTFDGRFLAFKG